MTMIGHNGGPGLEPGYGFRKLAWGKARKSLLKTLPIEILRVRVARARRLGLDYSTYASIRAASGHDVVAFLFSGNALDLRPRRLTLPDPVAARLGMLDGAAARLAAVHAPAHPGAVLSANPGLLDHAGPAPRFTDGWGAVREKIAGLVHASGLPADGVVLVSATAVEREWCAAGKLAGILPAERVFAPAP
ncbi:MAG: hypothetical protein R6U99_03090 [Nioella sp.]